jgi:outer membrane protein TolC
VAVFTACAYDSFADEQSNRDTPGKSLTVKSKSLTPDEQTLVLDDVVSAAVQFHPLITAAREERLGADGERLAAQGSFDRLIRGDFVDYATGGYSGTYYNMQAEQPFEFLGSKLVGGYRQSSGTFPIYDDYYNTNQEGEVRAGVEVPLLRDRDIDKRRAIIRKSTVQQEVAGLSLSLRRIDLARAAGLAYWEWVAAHRKNHVFEKLLRVAKDRDAQLTRRASVGDIARFDQTDNERQVLQRESQLLSGQRALQKSEFELSFFFRDVDGKPRVVTNAHPPKLIPLVSPPGMTQVNDRVVEAFAGRPELQRINGLIQQQEVELALAENDLLPKLDFQSYLARDLGAGSSNREETELKLGMKLEVPLQTRNQQGRIDQYSAKTRELNAQAEALRDRIRVEVQDALNAIKISRERVDVARRELSLAEQLEEGERTKFQQGDSNLIFINLREQTTADAAIREIDTVLDFKRALVSYRAALGVVESVVK